MTLTTQPTSNELIQQIHQELREDGRACLEGKRRWAKWKAAKDMKDSKSA